MATSCLLGFLPISSTTSTVRTQRRSSFDIPISSLYDHVSDTLAILHWLRLPERVNFKLALIAYRVLNGMVSSYLNKLVFVSRSSPSSVVVHAAAVQRTTHGVVVRALDSWSTGRGFDSDRGTIRATTLGKLFTPIVPLFTKQYNLVPFEGFHANAP